MRIAKEDVPVRIDVPGATARQQTDFGDVTGYGKMGLSISPLELGPTLQNCSMGLRATVASALIGALS